MEFTINQYYDSQDHFGQVFYFDDNLLVSNIIIGFCYLLNDSIQFKVEANIPSDRGISVLQSSIEIIRPQCNLVDFKYKLDSESFLNDETIVSYNLNYTKNFIVRYYIHTLPFPRPV